MQLACAFMHERPQQGRRKTVHAWRMPTSPFASLLISSCSVRTRRVVAGQPAAKQIASSRLLLPLRACTGRTRRAGWEVAQCLGVHSRVHAPKIGSLMLSARQADGIRRPCTAFAYPGVCRSCSMHWSRHPRCPPPAHLPFAPTMPVNPGSW